MKESEGHAWRHVDKNSMVAYIPHFGFDAEELDLVSRMFGSGDTVTRDKVEQQQRLFRSKAFAIVSRHVDGNERAPDFLSSVAEDEDLEKVNRALNVINRLMAAWRNDG